MAQSSPAVASLVSRAAIDPAGIAGTGAGGRVTKRDVERAIAARSTPQAPVLGPRDELVPLTHARRLVAQNTTRAKATIPHAWQTQEVDMSGVSRHRAAYREAFQSREGFGLTYLPYVLAAALAGLRAEPLVNATFTDAGIVVHRSVHLGVAVALDDSVVVPVIRDADALSLAGLARAANDLATRARGKTLTADHLTGGTFTVNNSGTFGTLLSYSVINPGQAGILTMEAIVDRPVVRDGAVTIRPMMYLCFSLDHRVIDGLGASRFLSACRAWLEAVNDKLALY